MLIRADLWTRIRLHFSEPEKAALRAAVTGEVICPPGVTIDPDRLPQDLRRKLDVLLGTRARP